MADAILADPIPPPPPSSGEDPLATPPLDSFIFSDDFNISDYLLSFSDDEGLGDLYLPSDNEGFVDSSTFIECNPTQLGSDHVSVCGSGGDSGGDQVFDVYLDIESQEFGEKRLNCCSPESGDRNLDIGCQEFGEKRLNCCSPESGDRNLDIGCQEFGEKRLNCCSPESGDRNLVSSSQGSGHCGSVDSEGLSLNHSSPDSSNSANNSRNDVVDQKVKVEELGNVGVLKRKKERGDLNPGSRTSKFRRSNGVENATNSSGLNDEDDDDEKKKARLIRNRESAQLSRQRKKHYVEELEDKVRSMHSTIQDLNARISYIVAENASLRQQMGVNGGAGGVCPPPPVMYHHPGMAPMPYPWMPCLPYVVKPQGSQVPLVPIPRLKPQQPAAVSKTKKVESKKGEGKTKKVASISFLGMLFFIMLFGGLVPMVNVKYRGMRDSYSGVSGSNYFDSRLYDKHHGRVLSVNGNVNGTNHNKEMGYNEKFGDGIPCGKGHEGSNEFKHNGSEPLVASLYVPRNDKLVKIDGNLIIHSVLASEKAKTSRQEMEMTTNKETSLAVALDLAPALPVSGLGRNDRKQPQQRALPSDEEYVKSKAADGKLQQWFREGLAGPLLSSGMCTEVFQFDVSTAIVPATTTSVRNMTRGQNSTNGNNKVRNRRILHGLPIPLPADNITKEHSDKGGNSHHKNSSSTSMVVSVLVDPREAGDGDGDGVMGKKSSFPRIFVVVLLDSVKYVTYSCMLPLMGGSSGHVVTT